MSISPRAVPPRALVLALAALLLAAPALAQNSPPVHQASVPADIDGMVPAYIICMGIRDDGQPEEISRTPWDGGAVPAEACPPESDPFHAYTLQAMTNIGKPLAPSHPEAGGTDHP